MVVDATTSGSPSVPKAKDRQARAASVAYPCPHRRPQQPPSDVHPGKRHVLVHLIQAGAADELTGLPDFERPPPETPMIELGLHQSHRGVALMPRQQWPQVLSDFGIGVHRRPRLEVGLPPPAEQKTVGSPLWHAYQATRTPPRCRPALPPFLRRGRVQLTDGEKEFIRPNLPIGEYGPYLERLRRTLSDGHGWVTPQGHHPRSSRLRSNAHAWGVGGASVCVRSRVLRSCPADVGGLGGMGV